MNTLPKLLVLCFTAATAMTASAATETWKGTLYNNNGHFGMANSEERLSADTGVIAGAPSAPESTTPQVEQSTTWKGTLYRNEGYFGPQNSDVQIREAR